MKGAIFDVDGTILDSMGAWIDLTKNFFAEHGIEITEEMNLDYQGKTLEETLPEIREKYMPQLSLEDMFGIFKEKMRSAYINTIQPKKHVCDYIHRLHDNGIRIAIATSGIPELIKAAFERIGIDDCIDTAAYSAEVGCGKTKPDIYLLAAKRLGIPPCDCTVYEDIITGIMSAKAAGFKTVAIEDIANAQDKNRLIQHSDRYITGWDELLSNI